MARKQDLTDKFLKSLLAKTDDALDKVGIKPGSKRPIVPDAQVSGFGVRLTESRPPHLTFVLVARFGGARNPAPRAIGEYPTVGLAEARETAREWRRDIEKGIDPKDKAEASRRAAEASRREEARKAKNTFEAAFKDYVEERRGDRDDDGRTKMRTLDVVDGVVKKHVLPILGNRPLGEITRAETNEFLKAIAKQTPTHARRIRSYLRTFGRWAEEDGRVEESPFLNLKRCGSENQRERVLSDDEIRAIWRASLVLGAFGRAVRMLLVTGQRRTEVGAMQWREIDETKRLWTLPGERTKAKRVHLVPLSSLAVSILSECPRFGSHVFATRAPRRRLVGGLSDQPPVPQTTTPLQGWSKAKTRLDALALAELKKIPSHDEARFPEWHLHDLRRTCATNISALIGERIVVSKVLNHAERGVTGTYDRHHYLPQKRAALDAWSRRLREIVEGIDNNNVVPFPASA